MRTLQHVISTDDRSICDEIARKQLRLPETKGRKALTDPMIPWALHVVYMDDNKAGGAVVVGQTKEIRDGYVPIGVCICVS